MKRFFLSSLLICSLLPLFAQGRFVKCNIKDGDDSVIKISQSSEKTEILGNISRTTVELIITNSSNRILEGEFEFPLEKGEIVTGFALDINGKMRNAVAIEKEKGRQVFEEIERKNVDPGLLEMTAGNSFKTRIYPIPAKGFRQIKITYEKKLSADSSAVKKDVIYTETLGTETYFYVYPNLDSLSKYKKSIKRETPASVAIYYDVSSSGNKRNIKAELSLLNNYLNKTKISNIQVVTFSNEIHEQKSFSSADETIKFLSNQTFDGATNLNLDFSKARADLILLVSDGIHNFGKEPEYSRRTSWVRNNTIALNSVAGADYLNLNNLAAETIDLTSKSEEEALNQLLYKQLRLLKIEYDESAINQITPEQTSLIDDSFCVSGILSKKRGTVKLSFGYDNDVILEKEFAVSSYETGNCVFTEGVNHLWATERIAELSKSYNKNKKEIITLAKKYTVVTPDTSLLVLDSVNDYIRYGIVPPEELQEEYNRLISRNQTTFKNENQSGIPAEVYTQFNEYKKWWNTNPKDFKKKKRRVPDDYEIAPSSTIARQSSEINLASKNFASEENLSSGGNNPETKASVKLQAWSSNAKYLSELKKTPENKMYEKYLELKKDYESSPAFYMEVAEYFMEENLKTEALRILSNLAEMNLENTDVLRALGNKLVEWNEYELACSIFEKLVALKPEVPQFLRDLGLAYNKAGQTQKACDTLWTVVTKKWDGRYSQIQQTVLNDLNSLIALSKNRIDTSNYDEKLLENFDVDVRVVLTWNTDDCDIDLWVTDSKGEKCFYGNRLTENGGRMSRDFTQGYGPEEFVIKSAPKGNYVIQANYYANHQQKLLQPIIVQAEVYTNFGRPNQTCQIMTLQLNDVKNTFDIGTIRF